MLFKKIRSVYMRKSIIKVTIAMSLLLGGISPIKMLTDLTPEVCACGTSTSDSSPDEPTNENGGQAS